MNKIPLYENKLKQIKTIIGQLNATVAQLKVDSSNLKLQMEKDATKTPNDDLSATLVKEKGAAIFARLQEGLKNK